MSACLTLMPLNVLCLADGVSWLCSTGGLDREPPCLWHYIMCHLRKRPTPWHLIKNSSSLFTSGGFYSPRDVSYYHNIEYKRLKEKTIFMKFIWLKIVGRNISDDYKLRIYSWLVEPGTSTKKNKMMNNIILLTHNIIINMLVEPGTLTKRNENKSGNN